MISPIMGCNMMSHIVIWIFTTEKIGRPIIGIYIYICIWDYMGIYIFDSMGVHRYLEYQFIGKNIGQSTGERCLGPSGNDLPSAA